MKHAMGLKYLLNVSRLLQWNKALLRSPSPHCVIRFSSSATENEVQTKFRDVMSKIPQPVAVVTSALRSGDQAWKKRGVTCSSVTSVSMQPPIISFAIATHSRMHDLLLKTERFAIHLLANNQVGYGIHFSTPAVDNVCQFESIPHDQDDQGVPVLRDTMAVVFCTPHAIHTIGDHHVWYGLVTHAYQNAQVSQPLLYFRRKFRSIGDEAFMKQFEEQTLPFEDWTHEAHIRMAWNYIKEFGKEQATPLIKNGIQRYNEQNKDKVGRGYHETVTCFYIDVVSDAIAADNGNADISTDNGNSKALTEEGGGGGTFSEFVQRHPHLLDRHLLFHYYSDECINRREAKHQYIRPDKKSFKFST